MLRAQRRLAPVSMPSDVALSGANRKYFADLIEQLQRVGRWSRPERRTWSWVCRCTLQQWQCSGGRVPRSLRGGSTVELGNLDLFCLSPRQHLCKMLRGLREAPDRATRRSRFWSSPPVAYLGHVRVVIMFGCRRSVTSSPTARCLRDHREVEPEQPLRNRRTNRRDRECPT